MKKIAPFTAAWAVTFLMAQAHAADITAIDIPAGDLTGALESLAQQSGLELVYRPEELKGIRTNGLQGTYSSEDAVRKLLEGTALTLQADPSGVLLISAARTTLYSSYSAQGLRLAQSDSASASTDADTSDSPKAEIEEVVVTATKREARLQDVPLAITSLTENALRNMSATGLEDYSRGAPSIALTDLGTGTQRIAIRGINPTAGVSAVRLYLGETPLPETTGNYGRSVLNPQLLDIERIEVLRGPQGTLYGAGSVGGTIRLVPREPNTSQWAGYLQSALTTTKSGGEGVNVSGVLDVPLAPDVAGIRSALWYEDGDGFVSRTFPGGSKDVPGKRIWGGRSIAAFKLSENLRLTATVMHEDRHYGGLQDITGGASNPDDQLVQVTLADTPERVDLVATVYNLTAKLTTGNVEWTSSSSYVNLDRTFEEEGTELVHVFFGGAPFANTLLEEYLQGDFTQELRLNTIERIAGFDLIFGGYFDHLQVRNKQRFSPEGFAETFSAPNDNLFTSDGTSFSKEFSVFGEAAYALTERLTATLGARRYDIRNGNEVTFDGLFNNYLTTTDEYRSHSKGTVKKANLSYQATADNLVYAQYAEGFRPGRGFAAPPPLCQQDVEDLGFTEAPTQVSPDVVKNYELGSKNTWFANRLTVNAAVFRVDWEDLQTSRQLDCGFTIGLNSETGVQVSGVEIETTLRVNDALSLGLSGGYNRAKFEGDEQALGAFAGDQVQDVPRFSGRVSMEYRIRPQGDWSGLLHLDVSNSGSSYSDFMRLADGVSRDPLSFRGSMTLLNVRLSAMRDRWEVALYGKNLTDDIERQERSVSSIFDVAGRPRYVVNQPRTLGIEVRRSFGNGT